jgi:hypothetical protein
MLVIPTGRFVIVVSRHRSLLDNKGAFATDEGHMSFLHWHGLCVLKWIEDLMVILLQVMLMCGFIGLISLNAPIRAKVRSSLQCMVVPVFGGIRFGVILFTGRALIETPT